MRKALLIVLGLIVVLGLLGGAGFAGYRVGYKQGAQTSAKVGDPLPIQRLERFDRMPRPDFHRFERGIRPGRFPMGPHMGFGFFGPLMFIGRIATWVLIIWFVFWLFTRSGWQLTRVTQPAKASQPDSDTPKDPKTEE